MPKVYNSHHKNEPKVGVYVGRPSKWGNPYSHLQGSVARFQTNTREEAIQAFEKDLLEGKLLISIKDIKEQLKGKDLVCWCAPKPCHADVLLRIANE
jgi:hypothetical protein